MHVAMVTECSQEPIRAKTFLLILAPPGDAPHMGKLLLGPELGRPPVTADLTPLMEKPMMASTQPASMSRPPLAQRIAYQPIGVHGEYISAEAAGRANHGTPVSIVDS